MGLRRRALKIDARQAATKRLGPWTDHVQPLPPKERLPEYINEDEWNEFVEWLRCGGYRQLKRRAADIPQENLIEHICRVEADLDDMYREHRRTVEDVRILYESSYNDWKALSSSSTRTDEY